MSLLDYVRDLSPAGYAFSMIAGIGLMTSTLFVGNKLLTSWGRS